MPRRNRNGNGNKSNGTGPSTTPNRTVRKKLQYSSTVKLNNMTSGYSYYSKYIRPDVTLATGYGMQFSAYELWRIRKIRVYIQMANNSTSIANDKNPAMNYATTSTVWTAADLGANEGVSGETIAQYSNVKKNTPSLNKWTKIVDTQSLINFKPGYTSGFKYILPSNVWLNTGEAGADASADYSGYQLFIQSFGTEGLELGLQPCFTLITELDCEFRQPAFQNNASTFSSHAFNMKMITQPDPADPTDLRTYVFNRITVSKNPITDERQMIIRLVREDGVAGSLTYNSEQLREAIINGNSGIYFDARPITYDGPLPPTAIPEIDYDLTA